MIKFRGQLATILLFLILLGISSCDYKGPEALWNPDYDLGLTPVITDIDPSAVAKAGITEIVINGQNFQSDITKNTVYFGNVKVDLKKATTNQLTVYRPNLTAEGFSVKVVIDDVIEHAVYSPYTVESVGGLLLEVKDLGRANAIAMDAEGNLLVQVDMKQVYKALDNGDLELVIDNTKPRIIYDMKVGSDGFLYMTRDRNYINRVPLGDGEWENFANGTPGNIKYMDFDSYDNIFAGGENTGLIFIRPDGSFQGLGGYTDYDIVSIRVFNDAVYVAAIYIGDDMNQPAAGIWSNSILSPDGSVGESVLVLDWTTTGVYTEATITDINFDENGVLYIATDGGPDNTLDPILNRKPDGEVDVFYKGGILKAPVYELLWGNDHDLYYLHPTGDINLHEIRRLYMAAAGAPDYGRQ
jgi:hypothetical protein